MAISYPGNIISATEKTSSTSSASGIWSLPTHMQKQKAGSWPSTNPAVVPDTYFNLTSLLLHGDGTNNANNTVVVDSSTNAFTVTNAGKPYQGTYTPFSQTGWSNYFNGSTDKITASTSTSYNMGSDAFTVECWVYWNGTSTYYQNIVGSNSAGFTGNATFLRVWGTSAPTSALRSKVGIGNPTHDGTSSVYSSSSLTPNTWNHIAATRSSGIIRIFINGVLEGTGVSDTSTYDFGDNGICIGTSPWDGANGWYSGYISNVRLIKGIALYTSNFTPPTSPLTAVSGTSILTCQDNRFKDNSTNVATLTPAGSTSVQPFSPFAPTSAYSASSIGGSIYFDGSSKINIATSTAFGFGTGDFTVELWAYCTFNSAIQEFIDARASDAATPWVLGITGTGVARTYDGSTLRTGGQLTANAWNHIAWVRASDVNTVYVNGVSGHTWTASQDFGSTKPLSIGNNVGPTNEPLTGYLSNIRIVKGTAVYTGSFTPPTTPLTAISNTSVLLSGTNAGIIDHTAKNVITTYSSSAKISTTQSKFGGSSISFGGDVGASCLILPSTQSIIIPASCDFTVECWVYTPTSSLAPAVWHNTSSQKIIAFYLTDAAVSTLYTIAGTLSYPGSSNAAVVRGSSNITANTWTHVAFVRSGSTITIYINGTAAGTGTSSYATNPLQLIGAIGTSSTPNFYFFNGYIDDLRITKYARYTTNFTAPTDALPNQ